MTTSVNSFLFRQIDNSPLIVFRIIFGLLCFLESVGAIFTGWVKRVFIDPNFTFNFIGFDWLQPLPGDWMYIYYATMGLLGLFIMVGYKYRTSMVLFTVLWTGTYLMQKTSYNNHYYLLCILSLLMIFMPAHRYASVDVTLNPKIKKNHMPYACSFVLILLMFIVYTYASIAKIYPDWLDGKAIELIMKSKKEYFLVGDFLQQKWFQFVITYGGIFFDGLIVPLLLIKKTRKYAFYVAIFFHLFNSFIIQVGVFPYLALGLYVFFFETKTIHRLFLKSKPFYSKQEIIVPKYHGLFLVFGILFFTLQTLLPLRHHFISDNVLWTEEGHRCSWRMMLRSKSGFISFYVVDKLTNQRTIINLDNYLSKKQKRSIASKPDLIWQFSQRLKREYAQKGKDISVYVRSKVSVNGRRRQNFIDTTVDLANVPWQPFTHASWILPSKLD